MRGINQLLRDQEILRLIQSGYGIRRIAIKLDITCKTVQVAKRRLGLTVRNGEKRKDRPDTQAEMDRVQLESEVYFLRAHQKLKLREIAERMNMTISAVNHITRRIPKNWAGDYEKSKHNNITGRNGGRKPSDKKKPDDYVPWRKRMKLKTPLIFNERE